MAFQDHKTGATIIAGWTIIALILIQFIPLDRIDRPSKSPSAIPDSVLAVLDRHCFSCHSGQTSWPRSAYIAPLSWYVTGKVRQARESLTFSNYDTLPKPAQAHLAQTVSRLAATTNLSAHGSIPGFPPVSVTEKERLVLAGWHFK
jgi:hypothetical protein